MKLKAALDLVRGMLSGVAADSSESDWIACEALGKRRGELGLIGDISDTDAEKMLSLARERATGKPLWQVFGYTDFAGYRIEVDENVLCPRPETEELAQMAASLCRRGDSVLDLCTGSGCIAVYLAKESGACVTACDLSEKALEVAERNARNNAADVKFVLSDLFGSIEGKFRLIASNPPYIPSADIDGLDSEVKDHEPRMALDGGRDGLDFYRRIAAEAPSYLEDGGYLLLETGDGQAEAVAAMLRGFRTKIVRDLEGKERMIAARLCGRN